MSNQDPLTGGWMSYLNPDAIEELEVIGAGAGVEFGRAQGGFAQIIQKQGSNDFEGLANVLWRSSRLGAGSADQGFSAAAASFTPLGALNDLLAGMAAATGYPVLYLSQFVSPAQTSSQRWIKRRRVGDVDIASTNPAPKVAVAWDPGGKGKSKVAVTAGRYYGTISLDVPLVEEDPVTATIPLKAIKSPLSRDWSNLSFSSGIDPAANAHVVDRGLRPPYQDEMTASFEREISPEVVARVAIISRRFRDQLQDVNINHHTGDYGRCSHRYFPTQPWIVGPPDGVPDDCDGVLVYDRSQFFPQQPPFHQSDGYLDSYVYNPGWGAIDSVGNVNAARYEGIVLEVTRRQYRNWQMQASYTWSRAIGDAEAFSSYVGDDPGNRDSEGGSLAYDQRHVVRINATTITPWGFRFGAATSWMSGLPYSILQVTSSADSIPLDYPSTFSGGIRTRTRYPTFRRNDQRNRPSLTLNVKLDKEFNLSGGQNLQVSLEVFNLLNDRNYVVYNPQLGYGRQVNGQNDATVAPGRQCQLGLRLAF